MNSIVGQLKREWLEHRMAFFWGPGAVLIIVLLAGLVAAFANNHADVELSISQQRELSEVIEANPVTGDMGAMEVVAAMALDVAGSTDEELRQKIHGLQFGLAQPFHLVFLVIAAVALLGGLYDERKDHSVLFWKSMPVSDVQSIASKVVFVLWLAPLVTIAAILVAQFLALVLTSLYVEDGMAGRLWAASGFWMRPFELLVGYLVLGALLLPFAAWLMLVSSRAGRLPFLWALGVPWALVVVERIFFGTSGLGRAISGHIDLLRVFQPSHEGVWAPLSAFAEPRMWGGLLVAGLLLSGAAYCRRRYIEL